MSACTRVERERQGEEDGGTEQPHFLFLGSPSWVHPGARTLLSLNAILPPASACPLPSPAAHLPCCSCGAPRGQRQAEPTAAPAPSRPRPALQAHLVPAGAPGHPHHSGLLTGLPEPTLASGTQPCCDLFKPPNQLCHLCQDLAVVSKCPHGNTPRSCPGGTRAVLPHLPRYGPSKACRARTPTDTDLDWSLALLCPSHTQTPFQSARWSVCPCSRRALGPSIQASDRMDEHRGRGHWASGSPPNSQLPNVRAKGQADRA